MPSMISSTSSRLRALTSRLRAVSDVPRAFAVRLGEDGFLVARDRRVVAHGEGDVGGVASEAAVIANVDQEERRGGFLAQAFDGLGREVRATEFELHPIADLAAQVGVFRAVLRSGDVDVELGDAAELGEGLILRGGTLRVGLRDGGQGGEGGEQGEGEGAHGEVGKIGRRSGRFNPLSPGSARAGRRKAGAGRAGWSASPGLPGASDTCSY